jgi:pullulanase/glycogen debranching enzyme
VAEFKAMVRALHQAGLEVMLDVVFNHTAEADEGGPSLCFRGLDNTACYRLKPGRPDQYFRHHRDRQLAGSYDLYGGDRRRPTASVNLITAHDGFTLRDLVSYDAKHNEANGESNRDGTDDNRSWNSGLEGPADDAAVLALRGQRSRAMLSTLLLSFGVPMLLGGDEIGRSQGGNNNAYCQDSEISWVDWTAADTSLLSFVRELVALRRSHPVFRRHRYLTSTDAAGLAELQVLAVRRSRRPQGHRGISPWKGKTALRVAMIARSTGWPGS